MTNEASLSKWLQEVRARLIVVGQKLRHHCREVIALQHIRVNRIHVLLDQQLHCILKLRDVRTVCMCVEL